MPEKQLFDDVCAPSIEVAADGRMLLALNTDRGPIALLMTGGDFSLLRDRIEQALARSKGVRSRVRFEGDPPFSLPAALGAVANARNGIVVATFSVVVPVLGPAPVPVEIGMMPTAADLLAKHLRSAVEASMKDQD